LRILDIDHTEEDTIWHLAAYEDMFLDIDLADKALENPENLTTVLPHAALTNRAFEATQTSRMKNEPLNEEELETMEEWKTDSNREISDRSVRLLLGLR
ncbi:MAG: hypothetical protein HKN25_17265, partial [Pyrinomonadaceae bacterium]|nr:hypothetical protein [Pyrinomonadaceae bacterium]